MHNVIINVVNSTNVQKVKYKHRVKKTNFSLALIDSGIILGLVFNILGVVNAIIGSVS